MLKNGIAVDMDKREAAHLYRLTAEKGEIYSMNRHAIMLKNGDNVSIDKREAARYFKMAADKG